MLILETRRLLVQIDMDSSRNPIKYTAKENTIQRNTQAVKHYNNLCRRYGRGPHTLN